MGTNKWGQAPFCKKEDILIQKMGPVPIYSYRKWGLSPFILKASLFSPSERNRARSAFLTVFSPYSLRQAREPDRFGQRVTHPPSLWWGQTLSLFWGTGYFLSCGLHLQVKSDPEGARLFPKTYALTIV
jgi:hypothetical protein